MPDLNFEQTRMVIRVRKAKEHERAARLRLENESFILHEQVVRALDRGVPLEVLMDEAGLSRSRIYAIRAEVRDRRAQTG
jgi:hypothetical protein